MLSFYTCIIILSLEIISVRCFTFSTFQTCKIGETTIITKNHVQSSTHPPYKRNNNPSLFPKKIQEETTQLYGIDYDALNEEDEDCDFFVNDLSDDTLGGTRTTTTTTTTTITTAAATGSTANLHCIVQPSPELSPEDVVSICLDGLMKNDEPEVDSGLEICYNFSSDRCRTANGGTLESFKAFASNPSYGFMSMVNAQKWTKLSIGPEIAGTSTRGAMKTVLVQVTPKPAKHNPGDRRFLWTLQKERRPPRQDCWLIHECIDVNNAFALTE